MPSVRVCFWNIQNYGWGDSTLKWGADSGLRNRLITTFLRAQQIDVLLIMEVGSNGEPSLRNLLSCLNDGLGAAADWAVSWCGSALVNDAAEPPRHKDQVRFPVGRPEGYAVAWRTKQLNRFRMLNGLYPIDEGTYAAAGAGAPASPLNLSVGGRPAGTVDLPGGGYTATSSAKRQTRGTVKEWRVLGGYVKANVFPVDMFNKPMKEWPRLLMPTTGAKHFKQLKFSDVRRPAYVALELKTQTGPALCPVCVYHAPSHYDGSTWGALQGGLARELYVTNGLTKSQPDPGKLTTIDRFAFGGDFNYAAPLDKWPSFYQYFLAPLASDAGGGAAAEVAPPGAPPEVNRFTVVELLKGNPKQPINSNAIDDYLAYNIDLAFYKKGDLGERANVPDQLFKKATNGPYAPVLIALRQHLDSVVRHLKKGTQRVSLQVGPEQREPNGSWTPMIKDSWGATFKNWELFTEYLGKGDIKGARQAAELYRLFISDHLPLTVELKL